MNHELSTILAILYVVLLAIIALFVFFQVYESIREYNSLEDTEITKPFIVGHCYLIKDSRPKNPFLKDDSLTISKVLEIRGGYVKFVEISGPYKSIESSRKILYSDRNIWKEVDCPSK